jgi:uncharacterized protein (TIGR02186 family)
MLHTIKTISLHIFILVLTMIVASVAQMCNAQPILNTSLSENSVKIDTDFKGAKITLFGHKLSSFSDLIVTAEGETINKVIIKKYKNKYNMWITEKANQFSQIPSFYQIYSSDKLNNILHNNTIASLKLGVDNLNITPNDDATVADALNGRNTILATMIDQKLISPNIKTISTINGQHLFSTKINIPANASPGTALITTYLVENNKVMAANIIPLLIERTGIVGIIVRIAGNPYEYAIFSICAAIAISVSLSAIANKLFAK